jgi:hypothetical protein
MSRGAEQNHPITAIGANELFPTNGSGDLKREMLRQLGQTTSSEPLISNALGKLIIISNSAMKSSCSEILKKVSDFLDGSFYNNSYATDMLTPVCRFIYWHFSKKESSNAFICNYAFH